MRAPAKINFGLRITARRPDGYHELESLFLPLDLADELEVVPRAEPGVALELSGEQAGAIPANAENLAARAARAFLDVAGLASGSAIRLRKEIPVAAGLGGGSSDAGAVLRALAALHPGRLAAEDLRAIALALGADVPFFLDPRPAHVRGIGERVEPAERVPEFALLLVNPGVPLATAEVYRAWDALRGALTPAPRPSTMRALQALREAGGRIAGVDPGLLAEGVANDLEEAATRLCPPVRRLRQRLREAGALAVGLSGSGPTLFGIFPDRAAAERAAGRAGDEALWCRVAQTLASP